MEKHQIITRMQAKKELYTFLHDVFMKFIFSDNSEQVLRDLITTVITHQLYLFSMPELISSAREVAAVMHLELPSDFEDIFAEIFSKSITEDLSIFTKQ